MISAALGAFRDGNKKNQQKHAAFDSRTNYRGTMADRHPWFEKIYKRGVTKDGEYLTGINKKLRGERPPTTKTTKGQRKRLISPATLITGVKRNTVNAGVTKRSLRKKEKKKGAEKM